MPDGKRATSRRHRTGRSTSGTVGRPRRVRRRTTRRPARLAAERAVPVGALLERSRRRLRLPPLAAPQVLALLVTVGVLAALAYVSLSLDFYVYAEDVTIVGTRWTSPEDVYKAAAVEGYHIFFVDPRGVAQRVAALPYVRWAQVHVGLPARVRIVVEERVPLLRWERSDDVFWVDAEGVVMPAREGAISLPTLVDPQGLAAWGEETEGLLRLNPQVLNVLWAVRQSFPTMRRAIYDPSAGLRLLIPFRDREVQVIWGDGPAVQERLRRLEEIWQTMERTGTVYTLIDVTHPNEVIVRR